MTILQKLVPVVLILVVHLSFSVPLSAAELYVDQQLFAEPDTKAEVAGMADKGPVSIVERRGYWVKIKSGKLVGWSKLYNVKMEVDESFLMPPIDALKDTGRLGAEK